MDLPLGQLSVRPCQGQPPARGGEGSTALHNGHQALNAYLLQTLENVNTLLE